MKTTRNPEVAPRRPGTRLPLFVLMPLALVAPLQAAEPVKDHALFVGATLHVGDTLSSPELVGAEGTRVAVLADGKVTMLPRREVGAVRIEMGLKLSSVVAQIDKLESKPVFLGAGVDRWAAERTQILLESMADQGMDAMDVAARREAEIAAKLTVAPAMAVPGLQDNLAQARRAFEAANAQTNRVQSAITTVTHLRGDFNALEVSCALSAPKASRDAYALLVTEYRTDSLAKPGYQIHIEPLGELGPTPRRVTMTQGGLPPGFLLGRLDVHVYANGQELATNLSAQRVDLTGEQALQYLTLNYVASHPKQTLPAVPQRIALPVGFKDRVPAALVAQSLYATVGPDGSVRQVASDTAGTAVPDAYVDAVVRKFRYNPALKEGKPVESVVVVRLGDYLR